MKIHKSWLISHQILKVDSLRKNGFFLWKNSNFISDICDLCEKGIHKKLLKEISLFRLMENLRSKEIKSFAKRVVKEEEEEDKCVWGDK